VTLPHHIATYRYYHTMILLVLPYRYCTTVPYFNRTYRAIPYRTLLDRAADLVPYRYYYY
jgi:hypothetical protein